MTSEPPPSGETILQDGTFSSVLNEGVGDADNCSTLHIQNDRQPRQALSGADSVRFIGRTGRLRSGIRSVNLDGFVVIGIGIGTAVHGQLVRQMIVHPDAH